MEKKEVEHVANLARLEMTDQEITLFTQQLAQILKHFGELKQLNTDGIEPMVTPSDIEYWVREDKVIPGPGAEAILQNAPARVGNLFKVPPVV